MKQAIIAARSSGVSPPDALAIVERESPDPGFHAHFLMVSWAPTTWPPTPNRCNSASVLFWDPAHAGMRGTPAFKRIVEQIGIPAYWREHGYPPQCRPVGRTDFECDR
jgi:hypothetical protein